MTDRQWDAVVTLKELSQKVVCCVSRQGEIGFLVDEAEEALKLARESGLFDDDEDDDEENA